MRKTHSSQQCYKFVTIKKVNHAMNWCNDSIAWNDHANELNNSNLICTNDTKCSVKYCSFHLLIEVGKAVKCFFRYTLSF